MNKMKRLTGILCIWFCKGAGHADGEEYPNLNLRQSLGNCIG